jgi:hypothetical protein
MHTDRRKCTPRNVNERSFCSVHGSNPSELATGNDRPFSLGERVRAGVHILDWYKGETGLSICHETLDSDLCIAAVGDCIDDE